MSEENTTIQEMRRAIEAANKERDDAVKERDDLNSRLTTLEREKMGDIERLNAEKADLAKQIASLQGDSAQLVSAREQIKLFEGKFESLYKSGIEGLPEKVREQATLATSNGSFAERYESLQALKTLIVETSDAAGPGAAAALTTTPAATPGKPTEPLDPKNIPPLALSRPEPTQ